MKKILLKQKQIYQGNLRLVNRKCPINQDTQDENLVAFSEENQEILLEENCKLQLQEALQKIKAENQIVLVSGYRSLAEQTEIFENSLKENGEKFTKQYVAYPNCSEHQTGLAIDLGLNQKEIDFIRPSFPKNGICEEFREIMDEYGFIQRYIKEKELITEISSEEWHFRYVGLPHAKIMKQKDMCLEEYIAYLQEFEYGKKVLYFEEYEISFVKMDQATKMIQAEENEMVTISGNNINGIIVTKRKKCY